jgi:hypothetical protein
MPAPDGIILEILINNTRNGDTDPLAATAELSDAYRYHPEWVDRHRCAAIDIEHYKKRNAFKPEAGQGEFSIVVLSEGKERRWSFFKNMTKRKIAMRIAMILKKDEEHHAATEAEIAYWNSQIS